MGLIHDWLTKYFNLLGPNSIFPAILQLGNMLLNLETVSRHELLLQPLSTCFNAHLILAQSLFPISEVARAAECTYELDCVLVSEPLGKTQRRFSTWL